MYSYIGYFLATILLIIGIVLLRYPPLFRDLYTIYVSLKVVRRVKRSCAARDLIVDQFERQARLRPNQSFIVFKEQRFSYSEVNQQANRVAHVLVNLGVGHGDTIAIVMTNEPALLWIYLGVQKLGARIALVNHHLIADPLRHSIICCSPKLVIVADGLGDNICDRVIELQPALNIPVYTYHQEHTSKLPCFSNLLEQTSGDPFPCSLRCEVKLSDPCAFIFTSGTTGLPKPAVISHKKAILCSHSYGPVGFSEKDVLYLTLPLYHASALNLAFLNVINVGATLVLREKFSVSNFWSDCVKYNVTCFQYIGEMLRYLVYSRQHPDETRHKLWFVVGNGLRQDIWNKFQSRFRIPKIFEFYGSTELPAGATNFFNIPGSVGRLSPLLSRLMNQIIVKVDPEKNEPFRNSRGRCEVITPGDSGLLLAKLTSKVIFDGYFGPPTDTNSKIIKDVLEDGDLYVNTNDVFTMDAEFNLFFKDRIGDSFRWKGENVSTAEVSNVINTADFVQDSNVFGVPVPGCEGKTGMVAINLKDGEKVDRTKVEELGRLCREKLPGYARPRFLRFDRQMSLTSTFKQEKTKLTKEGYNPLIVKEPLYFLDRSSDEFKPLNQHTYEEIIEGHLSL